MSLVETHPLALSSPIKAQPPVCYLKTNWADSWVEKAYLECVRDQHSAAPGLSRASFLIRYGSILREDQASFAAEALHNLANKFVQVRVEPPDSGGEIVLWTGYIPDVAWDIHGTRRRGGSYIESGDHHVTAYGLEYLLDLARIRDGRVADFANPGGEYGTTIEWMPAFNDPMPSDIPYSTGNREGTITLDEVYCFISATLYAENWTNDQIIKHLLKFYAPTTGVCSGMTWSLDDPGGYTARTVRRYDLGRLSVRDALNVLIDRRRGHAWTVVVDGSAVKIHVDALFTGSVTVGGTSLTGNTTQHDLVPDMDRNVMRAIVGIRHSHRAHKLIIQGQRIKSTFSIDYAVGGNNSMDKGWSNALETAYKSADGATDPEDADKTRKTFEKYSRVYCRHLLNGYGWWEQKSRDGTNVIPILSASGTLTVATKGAWWPQQKRFLGWLPFHDESSESGYTFHKPLIFCKRPGSATEYVRLRQGYKDENDAYSTKISSTMAQNEMAFILRPEHPHIMGWNHFDTTAEETTGDTLYDYDDLVATVQIETDERLRLELTLAGGSGPEKTVVIDVPNAEMWFVTAGTIDGLNEADNTLHVYTGQQLIRDDRGLLEEIAALAKAWYGRDRQQVMATVNYIDTFIPVLAHCHCDDDGRGLGSVDTVVTELVHDYVRSTTTIRTDFMEFDAVNMVLDQPDLPSVQSLTQRLDADAAYNRTFDQRIGSWDIKDPE